MVDEQFMQETRDRLLRLEAGLNTLLTLMGRGLSTPSQGVVSRDDPLWRMTTKQHAALQMLMNGSSNAQIAERFGVTENTAKVYVRGLAKHLGVHTRAQIVASVLPGWPAIDPHIYREMSGGLPKNWHEKFRFPDPYRDLYGAGDT